MIRANGKKYVAAYWNGKYYTRAYYNGKVVMLTPDNNTYLLAAPGVKLLCAPQTPLLATLAPALTTASTEYDINRPFCLRFKVKYDAANPSWLLSLGSVVRFKSVAEGIVLRVGKDAPRLIPATLLRPGENLIELARHSSYLWFTGLFINHVFYNVRLQESGYAVAQGYMADKSSVFGGSFSETDALSAESSWPALTVVKGANLVPTDITRDNMHGFVFTDTLRETDPLNAFNPMINPSYPRWQASGLGAECTIQLPAGKKGSVLRYSVVQWYDNTYTSRKCTQWRLSGSLDGETYTTIHEVLSNPWKSDVKGDELVFDLKNRTDYRWLRFTMLDNPGHGSYCSIGQLRFLTEDPNGTEDFILEK